MAAASQLQVRCESRITVRQMALAALLKVQDGAGLVLLDLTNCPELHMRQRFAVGIGGLRTGYANIARRREIGDCIGHRFSFELSLIKHCTDHSLPRSRRRARLDLRLDRHLAIARTAAAGNWWFAGKSANDRRRIV